MFRSTDSGETWTRIWDWGAYPNRELRYTMDYSVTPWLDLGANPQPPEIAPKLGWMTEAMEIDPFDSNRFVYGTGMTIWGSTNLTTWDSGGQITLEPMILGLEETAVLDLVSPPTGAPLVSALGDIGGFRHNNVDEVPDLMLTSPYFTSTNSLDYAELTPSTMVRAGSFDKEERPNDMRVAFSTDGGANWFQAQEPSGVTGGGTVAAAADGSRFVWSPQGTGVHYSAGFGNSWQLSSGIPAGAIVESDRVDPNVFYGYANGAFYVSTNGGQSFTETGASGLPTADVKFKAVPGMEGEIWLAGDGGLWRSSDTGAAFTRLPGVESSRNVGFGAAAPGEDYLSVYAVATIDGVEGVWRSDDTAASWVRVNDDEHQHGNMGEALTGDLNRYGRVYLGTNGRGILVGDTK